MSIELEPSVQLCFRRPLTEAIKESLIIRNPTQLPIAFKVKTTAPKQYCVRPNSGRIEPGAELEVQVQMQAMKEEPPADFKCKDKFLVQSVAITAEREQLPAADLWPTMERDAKDQIREKKIRCVFVHPTEPGTTRIKGEDEHGSQSGGSSTQNAPTDAHQQQHQQTEPAPIASPIHTTQASRSSHSASSSSPSSNIDVSVLKRELEIARETIQTLQNSIDKLQKETNTVRPRKPESNAVAPTVGAIQHQNYVQQGLYPISYVAGAAVIAFLFAYLFF
ncbi:phosphatidylinositol-binding protein scs2 [Lobosporangium transversale]|uniref:PapD-like protein n=1 Tax=Lobosporangium transversale TaxID=64571 RepID=A0A1Y2G977_9FUNG|nr:PapD-like protein [Lobosporangium transversale]KAF9908711.1 phosphatidylinositol-binding protein scs2 [Lobosporangium transversale]ORZ00013.1 PapD-like protein [Lobosporangium transversale]|eukprot:XP_021876054.1 PapD-like protein [Lobosporangium transversale]